MPQPSWTTFWAYAARMLRYRGLFVLAMVISTNAEGHGFVHLQDWFGTQVVVLEELVETWGYVALWLAQWALIRHTAGWR